MCGCRRQFGMNLLEKVGDFIAKRGEDLHQQISGKRVFSAHITNATKKVLEVQGKPMVSYGRSRRRKPLVGRETDPAQHQETTCGSSVHKLRINKARQLTFHVKVPRVL